MARTLLITGATGAIGLPLLAELLRRQEFDAIIALTRRNDTTLDPALRMEEPRVDLSRLQCEVAELGTGAAGPALGGLPRDIECIVHAAACTRFRAPTAELQQSNRDGTRQLLAWAESLPHAPRVVHLSTTCVAGRRCGRISEGPLTGDCGFVNDYERTKWEAEQLMAASALRPEIVRLATVIGDSQDGRLRRPGAFHTTLRWLHAGLLPMVPGDEATRLDLLPTDLVTEFMVRLLAQPARLGAIYHVSRGARGVPLGALLDLAVEKFSARDHAWRTAQILPPVLASQAAFESFRAAVVKTRDFLFNQVLESVDSFLPELSYPKVYATTHAEAAWGGPLPLPAWHEWLGHVIDYALASDFARLEQTRSRP
ncbi:MAG: SDR family oxidoreductase [Opitutaceae bacterium]